MPPKATVNRTFWWESCDQARGVSGMKRASRERIDFGIGEVTALEAHPSLKHGLVEKPP
jgi:hypothetical protein